YWLSDSVIYSSGVDLCIQSEPERAGPPDADGKPSDCARSEWVVVLVNISTRPAPQIGHPTRPSGERTARWTSARRTQAAPGQTRVARAAPGQTRVARAAPGQTRVARSIRGAAPRAEADRVTHRDDRLPVHTLGPAQQPSGVDGCSCRTPQRAVGCLASALDPEGATDNIIHAVPCTPATCSQPPSS